MLPKVIKRLPSALALTFVLFGILAAFGIAVSSKGFAPIAEPIDFLAFHSAARAAATGRDPYLAEPLRSYERNALAESGIEIVPNLVVPAPLPPYELALFSPLNLLSFRLASALWFVSSLVAIALTIVLLRHTTRASLFAIVPAVVLADGLASTVIGQVVPLVLFAVVAAGYALERDKPRCAALLVLASACEPHIGLGAILGLFFWEPRARRVLLAGLVVLAVLSLSSGGVARNIEYFTVVLPAQAHGEGLEFGGQYSLSALLAAFGTPATWALAAGSAWYAVMIIVATSFARRVSVALHNRSAIVFLPTALSVIGGTYVHIHQIAFALPLLFLIVARRGRIASAALFALLLLAVPWETFYEFGGPSHTAVRRVDVASELRHVAAPGLPAEAVWAVWVRSGARDARTLQERLIWKLPTWFGLFLLSASTVCCVAVRAKRDNTALSERVLHSTQVAKCDISRNGSADDNELEAPFAHSV
jgi:hypothetical protein